MQVAVREICNAVAYSPEREIVKASPIHCLDVPAV